MFTPVSPSALLVVVGLLVLSGGPGTAAPRAGGPGEFAFLQPWFRLTDDESERLARRGVVARALPADDRQIGVIATCAINLSPEAFVSRVRSGWTVDHGQMTSGPFGDPPQVADVAQLSLDDGDIDRLRRCRSGDCRLNLGNHEISAVRSALAKSTAGPSSEIQVVFRNVLVDRARQYRTGGLQAVPDYHDRSQPVKPAAIFSAILDQSPFLQSRLPQVSAYLRQFPSTTITPPASFLHWSKVMMNGKAVVRVSHVSVFTFDPDPQLPAVVIAGKQIYASRYMNGELTLTMLFAGANGAPSYLVHVDRSELDELGGAFSGLKRSLIEGRIKDEAVGALAKLRDRLEGSSRR